MNDTRPCANPKCNELITGTRALDSRAMYCSRKCKARAATKLDSGRPCVIENCTKTGTSAGLCTTHSARKRRGQDMHAPIGSIKRVPGPHAALAKQIREETGRAITSEEVKGILRRRDQLEEHGIPCDVPGFALILIVVGEAAALAYLGAETANREKQDEADDWHGETRFREDTGRLQLVA